MPHPRLAFQTWPAAVYAIGDVHGCLDQLLALERLIVEDGLDFEGEKLLITLGDHIDRGPDSASVIDHIMAPPPRAFRRISLLGNHETMLIEFLRDPEMNGDYLAQGGHETLRSYARRGARATDPFQMPAEHRAFIEALPICVSLPGWLFVHAGIRPGIPLAQQTDEDLIWIRAPFLNAQLTGGFRVVHGHTPVRAPLVTPHRIDIDTQCFATGTLTAVRVTPDGRTKLLSVSLPSRSVPSG